jgi:hypothetical protein
VLYYCNWETGSPVCTADVKSGYAPLAECKSTCHAGLVADA